jgi:AbrB family looped-hinge helix DNA binding protein
MPIATATTKGQITIPAEIRKQLKIESGTRVRFEITEDGCIFTPLPEDSLEQMKGMFSNNGVNLSIDELIEATGQAAALSGLKGLDYKPEGLRVKGDSDVA